MQFPTKIKKIQSILCLPPVHAKHFLPLPGKTSKLFRIAIFLLLRSHPENHPDFILPRLSSPPFFPAKNRFFLSPDRSSPP